MKILIIEDSDNTVELMQDALSHLEADIRRVSRLGSGLQEKMAWSPDFVLLDLELPDSFRASTIRAIPKFNKDSSVIVMSEAQGQEEIESILHGGADGFLKKSAMHDSGDLIEGMQQGWERFCLHTERPQEELQTVAKQLRAPNILKDLTRLTKSGRISKAAAERAKTDPIGAEVLSHVLALNGEMADFKVNVAGKLTELKSHLTNQDIEDERKWLEQKEVDGKILEQTTLHNGRLTTVETWKMEKEKQEKEAKDAEAMREGARNLIKAPFKMGWKVAAALLAIVLAGSTIKDFLEFILNLLKNLLPHPSLP